MTGGSARGDHFSSVSAAYAEFRPRYPRALFEFVASVAPRRHRVWDCGAGSGQATIDLAEWFDEVVATDVSAAQIGRAPRHPKVRWLVAPAEQTPLETGSIDVVTVAQALHWFDHAAFYAEVRRVAAPRAVIVAWTYGSPVMEGELGERLSHFMYGTLESYWPPERKLVRDEYRTIPFPFARIEAPRLVLEEEWTPEQLLGYARSWSATARYVAMHRADPVPAFRDELNRLWPDGAGRRRITWPLIVLAGRVGA